MSEMKRIRRLVENNFFRKQGFTPDWSEAWTKEEAEKELSYVDTLESGAVEHTFTFNGPGWYIAKDMDGKDDVILVVPLLVPERPECLHTVCPFGAVCRMDWKAEMEKNPFREKWPQDTLFQFNVYNGRNPMALFGLLASAPVRHDER